jgi:hypothetical protein
MMKLSVAALLLFGLAAGVAHADSIDDIRLNGTIGGPGGYHTIIIDGVTCKLKNGSKGGGAGAGCNYTLSGGIAGQGQGSIVGNSRDQGCSIKCE